MVKGVSRQVIVVHSPEPKLFEQAIFILKDDAVAGDGITDEALMKEANRLLRGQSVEKKVPLRYYGPAWACGGAALTGLAWLISSFL